MRGWNFNQYREAYLEAYSLQRCIQNHVKHLRWRILENFLTGKSHFTKRFSLNVWQGSKSASALSIDCIRKKIIF